MNIWQEMIEVGKFPTGSDHCSLFHNTPTTVYYYVTRVHSHDQQPIPYGGVNVTACFHNTEQNTHVFRYRPTKQVNFTIYK